MKKVYKSNETRMVLESMDNIDKDHKLYNTFYEKEVDDNFKVNVYGNAEVYGNARVYGNAEVSDNARVYGNARVCGEALVYGNARVCGDALVYGNAIVTGNAEVWGNARVYGNARVTGNARVYGNARVTGNAEATKQVINLIGLPYSITITDKHIQIGCKQFAFETAKKLAERNIDIDSDDYNEMIKYKDLLLELIKVRES